MRVVSVEDVMTPLAVSAANGSVDEPSAYTSVERREAADIDAVGKYEPKLTENGIPRMCLRSSSQATT